MPHEIIPIFGMITGIISTGFFCWAMVQVARGPIGQALARRIQGRHGSADPELQADLQAMRDQIDFLQAQLIDTQERLDFTERMLSQQRQGLLGEVRHE
ncbi:MAG TPA: hypothetical protein VG817_00575 [Gemmatimonadales bacterium]|nr:hypothetical protein [Gemmatimonadales bacterium]